MFHYHGFTDFDLVASLASELSSDGGTLQSLPDVENELREIRLTLLMEIEKRKQAEETLNNLRRQWQRIREQLSLVGLSLPADLATLGEGEQPADPAAELCQQVYLARFVSNTIGRGVAKAEVEMEMEAQISLKNTEIARLMDKLRYFEAVNQEMSQRNQEVVGEFLKYTLLNTLNFDCRIKCRKAGACCLHFTYLAQIFCIRCILKLIIYKSLHGKT